jgi:hypothetical protein
MSGGHNSYDSSRAPAGVEEDTPSPVSWGKISKAAVRESLAPKRGRNAFSAIIDMTESNAPKARPEKPEKSEIVPAAPSSQPPNNAMPQPRPPDERAADNKKDQHISPEIAQLKSRLRILKSALNEFDIGAMSGAVGGLRE